ncbi:hypothetical protein S83_021270 [Arachis hypogaea]
MPFQFIISYVFFSVLCTVTSSISLTLSLTLTSTHTHFLCCKWLTHVVVVVGGGNGGVSHVNSLYLLLYLLVFGVLLAYSYGSCNLGRVTRNKNHVSFGECSTRAWSCP